MGRHHNRKEVHLFQHTLSLLVDAFERLIRGHYAAMGRSLLELEGLGLTGGSFRYHDTRPQLLPRTGLVHLEYSLLRITAYPWCIGRDSRIEIELEEEREKEEKVNQSYSVRSFQAFHYVLSSELQVKFRVVDTMCGYVFRSEEPAIQTILDAAYQEIAREYHMLSQ